MTQVDSYSDGPVTTVTSGKHPGRRSIFTRPAFSRSRSARDLAFRSTPSTATSDVARRTVYDFLAPTRRQSANPTASALPGSLAAVPIQGHGTGPFRNSLTTSVGTYDWECRFQR